MKMQSRKISRLVGLCVGVSFSVGIGIAGHIVDEGRPPATCVVAGARTLDLDDIGTKITQHLGGPWAGEDS